MVTNWEIVFELDLATEKAKRVMILVFWDTHTLAPGVCTYLYERLASLPSPHVRPLPGVSWAFIEVSYDKRDFLKHLSIGCPCPPPGSAAWGELVVPGFLI